MNIVVWIFQNVLPWIGLCFLVLTLIYFITFIILMIKEKKDITGFDYLLGRSADISVIVSIIPLLMIAGVVYLVLRIKEYTQKQ